MKKYSIIIVLLITICVIFVACAKSEKTEVPANIQTDSNIEEEIATELYTTAEELVNELYGSEDNIQTNSNEAGIETIYEPAVEFPGYELFQVELLEHYVMYYYKPLGSTERFSHKTGITVSYYREGIVAPNTALDAIAEQYDLEYTEDGFLYNQDKNFIVFPVGGTRMKIVVPDSMNDYDLLKEFCQARKVTVGNQSSANLETE